jgi:hypothetical protein
MVLARAYYVVNLMIIVQSIMNRLYIDFLGLATILYVNVRATPPYIFAQGVTPEALENTNAQ